MQLTTTRALVEKEVNRDLGPLPEAPPARILTKTQKRIWKDEQSRQETARSQQLRLKTAVELYDPINLPMKVEGPYTGLWPHGAVEHDHASMLHMTNGERFWTVFCMGLVV